MGSHNAALRTPRPRGWLRKHPGSVWARRGVQARALLHNDELTALSLVNNEVGDAGADSSSLRGASLHPSQTPVRVK